MPINYTDIVKSLPSSVPFVGPETQERELDKIFDARIGANESVFGPSPLAMEKMNKAMNSIWMYGDPENYDLKNAIAKKHNLSSKNILVGEGIDGILGYLVRMFIEKGDNVVTTDGSYPTFNYHVNGYGGTLIKASFKNDHENINELVEKANCFKAKIMYVSNPNNPMGTINNANAIEAILENLNEETVLCLDEAYADFVPENELPKISETNKQVLRMRTFSKAYGLAGARVGYCIGHPDLIASFDKVRNHFGMCRISQIGALASLADKDHLNLVIKKVRNSIQKLENIAKDNGCKFIPTYTNFLAIDCGLDGLFAKKVLDNLVSNGIFVRMPFTSPQNRCIRVSAGTEDDMELFEKFFPIALNEAKRL